MLLVIATIRLPFMFRRSSFNMFYSFMFIVFFSLQALHPCGCFNFYLLRDIVYHEESQLRLSM